MMETKNLFKLEGDVVLVTGGARVTQVAVGEWVVLNPVFLRCLPHLLHRAELAKGENLLIVDF